MPLGASITYGLLSSTGNGYREPLRSQLVSAGNPVNMVGSRQHGSMVDNDVEGWSGFVVDQIAAKAVKSLPRFKPNVVLVNAGTNDAAQSRNVSFVGSRMESMLADIWDLSPRAAVVLSTLLVNKNTTTEANVKSINLQYQLLAQTLRQDGKHIVLVDMHGDDGPMLEDLADGTHPTDTGYKKMANIWYRGLVELADQGWLQRAEDVDPEIPDDGGVS
jgi:lysophospholipase L1-like esterase